MKTYDEYGLGTGTAISLKEAICEEFDGVESGNVVLRHQPNETVMLTVTVHETDYAGVVGFVNGFLAGMRTMNHQRNKRG